MSKFTWPILIASGGAIVGILIETPLVIAFCTLAAGGMILLALLSFFETAQ